MSFTIVIDRATFDTNILVYSIDTRDPEKHFISKRLVKRYAAAGCKLPLQSLNEFCRAATKPGLLSLDAASDLLREWNLVMRVSSMSMDDLYSGIELCKNYRLQVFDAMLLATVSRIGCTTLFSEDMQHMQSYGVVQVVNPFKLTTEETTHLLA